MAGLLSLLDGSCWAGGFFSRGSRPVIASNEQFVSRGPDLSRADWKINRLRHLGLQEVHGAEEGVGLLAGGRAQPDHDGGARLLPEPDLDLGGPGDGLGEIQAVIIPEFRPGILGFRIWPDQDLDDLGAVPACREAAGILLIHRLEAVDGARNGVVGDLRLFGWLVRGGHGVLLLLVVSLEPRPVWATCCSIGLFACRAPDLSGFA